MALVKCPECGAEISDSSAVCIHCGYDLNSEKKKHRLAVLRRCVIAAGIILISVGAVFALWKCVFPDIFTTKEEYLARGDYQSAYQKVRTDEERGDVIAENAVAVVCGDCVDSMKDPTSFVLNEAGYIFSEDGAYEISEILLSIMGKNSYGSYITNYWRYEYDESTQTFELSGTYSDFEEETIYTWDDAYDSLKKAKSNLEKSEIALKLALGSYTFLSEEAVENINNLFEAGTLKNVVYLEVPNEVSETEALDVTDTPE